MIEIRKLVLSAAVALALCACGNEGSEDEVGQTAPDPASAAAAPAPAAPGPEANEAPAAEQLQTVNVAANAVTVGTSLQGDSVVKAARAQFTLADTVYASASVRGKPAGADVVVYWTYVKNGASDKQETRKLAGGEQTIWFSFAKTDGMKPGKYNVEIDVDMRPVGITDFEIN